MDMLRLQDGSVSCAGRDEPHIAGSYLTHQPVDVPPPRALQNASNLIVVYMSVLTREHLGVLGEKPLLDIKNPRTYV